MKTATCRWLVLLLIPGCILVQPLDDPKTTDGVEDEDAGSGNGDDIPGKAGSGNSGGGPAKAGSGNSGGGPAKAGSGNSGGTSPTAGSGNSAGRSTGGGGPAPTAGSGSGGASSSCSTATFSNDNLAEKVQAASCVGIAYDDTYTCTLDAAGDQTLCTGKKSSYQVIYTEVNEVTVGVIEDLSENILGTVVQNEAGAYEIEWLDGTTGTCTVTGKNVRLCFDAI
ncbi:MAG: hypothetical protein WDO74_09185 [Pseudomonadota bacterium]